MRRGAVFGVLAGLLAYAPHSHADIEREAALEAYTLAMEAYAQAGVSLGTAREVFLCGYGIANRAKSIKPISVERFESLAGWHIGELVCAGKPSDAPKKLNTRYLMSPVPVYGLAGFEFEFDGRTPHKLEAVGVALQSRALDRILRRREMPTVPITNDVVGEGEIQKLRIGRELIRLSWKLRLAEDALSEESSLFGKISPSERASLAMLISYLDNEPEPDEDAFSSYKDRLFPKVFKTLDHLGYAYFDGPGDLSADRIARELFLSSYINQRAEGERDFMLTSDEDKVDLVTDMIRKADVRRAMTLFARLDDGRDFEEASLPTVYTVFRDASGRDAIEGKIDYVPLNWGRVREAARPADESLSELFIQKAEAAHAAALMMRGEADKIRGLVHRESGGAADGAAVKAFADQADAGLSTSLHDPRDIRINQSVAINRFSSGIAGLTSPEAQNTLSQTVKLLEGVLSGLAGKPWAKTARKDLQGVLDGLTAVKTLEQDLKTQERLAEAGEEIAAATQALINLDPSDEAGAGVLIEGIARKLQEARAKALDVRALLYDGHAALFRSQTKECNQVCDVLVETAPFDAELVLSGFFVGRTGGKSARLTELSVKPARVQGFDVLRVVFADKDGRENNAAVVQYGYVQRSAIAYGKAFEVSGTGTTTVTRDAMSESLTYPVIQSFSFTHVPDPDQPGAARDVVIRKLGLENTETQTRVYIEATGRDEADVSERLHWSVGLVEVMGSTVTRPGSSDRPFAWPLEGTE